MWSTLRHFVGFLDKFAESSNFFAALLGSGSSLLECMLEHFVLCFTKIYRYANTWFRTMQLGPTMGEWAIKDALKMKTKMGGLAED